MKRWPIIRHVRYFFLKVRFVWWWETQCARFFIYPNLVARSRRRSSFSTASRMNSERLPGPASASIRARTFGDKRMAVNFTPSGGRPIRPPLSVTQIFASLDIRGLTYPLYVTYISVTQNGGKAMAKIIHSEFFWSRRSAEQAGERLKARHGFDFSVRWDRRADLSHDWLLRVFYG